jgi:hypothetical protein
MPSASDWFSVEYGEGRFAAITNGNTGGGQTSNVAAYMIPA